VFSLTDEVTVGRGGGCGVAINDRMVSQLHARIFRRNGQLFIEDLGSTNGTLLNGKKVSAPAAVRKGDRLQVGKTVLEVTGSRRGGTSGS
jgi:pSer/pThr/pTyr-binding forkhead associated (FHA) protein